MSVSPLNREFHDEGRARPGTAVDAHRPAQLFNDAANDEESQAQPVGLTGADRAFERLEDPPVEIGRGSIRSSPTWSPARMTTGRPCPYLTALATRLVTT